jgi:hypothetical protein
LGLHSNRDNASSVCADISICSGVAALYLFPIYTNILRFFKSQKTMSDLAAPAVGPSRIERLMAENQRLFETEIRTVPTDPAAFARATGVPWTVVDGSRPVEEAAKEAGLAAGFRQDRPSAITAEFLLVSDGHVAKLINPWSSGNQVPDEGKRKLRVYFYTHEDDCSELVSVEADETVGEFTRRAVLSCFKGEKYGVPCLADGTPMEESRTLASYEIPSFGSLLIVVKDLPVKQNTAE